MKEGPDIALLGNMIGYPARANMLLALMSGKALTASELACEAGITSQTASFHLGKLEAAGMLVCRKQGRHRYFALSGPDVGHLLETLMGLAARQGHLRTRTGPRDEAMRKARICYNHLAGDMGVMIYDALLERGFIEDDSDRIDLTDTRICLFRQVRDRHRPPQPAAAPIVSLMPRLERAQVASCRLAWNRLPRALL